jgi:hypothetical protein
MPAIKFVALDTDIVTALRGGAPDANGHAPERRISDGGGVPSRHSLRPVPAGAPYLILAHRPFPAPQPYAEVGPIFLAAEPTERYPETDEIPPALSSPQYIVRGYGGDDRIVYGTGKVVATDTIPDEAARLLMMRDDIAYVHVRSASNNCYQCRIERG